MWFVERRVKTAGAQVCPGILRANDRKPLQREAGCGVHGQIEDDQSGFAEGGFVECLAGEIETMHGMLALAEPGGGRSEAKRLAAQFVGGE